MGNEEETLWEKRIREEKKEEDKSGWKKLTKFLEMWHFLRYADSLSCFNENALYFFSISGIGTIYDESIMQNVLLTQNQVWRW